MEEGMAALRSKQRATGRGHALQAILKLQQARVTHTVYRIC
jgi:hypothetical protein